MRKRAYKPVELQVFDALANGSAAAPEESSSMDEPRPAEVESPLASEPAPDSNYDSDHPSPIVPSGEPSLALPASTPVQPAIEQRLSQLEAAVKMVLETRITNRPIAEPAPPQVVPTAHLVAPNVLTPTVVSATPTPAARTARSDPWLLKEMIAEARAFQYMFFDPRYTMSWQGRFLPTALLAMFVTTGFWVPFASAPGIGWLFQKIVDLVLGFVLFKVLGHEARRYRETAPDLPAWLRL